MSAEMMYTSANSTIGSVYPDVAGQNGTVTATSTMAIAAVQRRTFTHAVRMPGACSGRRATARATCSGMPKSVASASSQPMTEASEKMPNASCERRRAATTVMANTAAFPAMSDTAR